MSDIKLNKFDIVYYARIMPTLGIYDVYDLVIRSVKVDYFVGIEKRTKRAFLFSYKNFGDTVFTNRKEALYKVKEAEKHKRVISTETYYEEY